MSGLRRAAAAGLILLAPTSGCSTRAPCADGAITVREGGALRCDEAEGLIGAIQVVAARPLTEGQRRVVLEALAQREADAPGDAAATLRAAVGWADRVRALPAVDAGVERSRAVAALDAGGGLLPGPAWESARRAGLAAAAVWARAPDGLVLTEMDIEGLIRLSSLCREVQGGSPLLVSVADRVAVYAAFRERFESADEATRRAMVAVGPFWPSLRDAWRAAPAEVQQAWVAEIPLPPPMTSDSPGYAKAVAALPLEQVVGALHARFGPLRMETFAR